jgi:D-arabinose 1-dehydrogenase-like Zn-dependent alcohol dehydrogenase
MIARRGTWDGRSIIEHEPARCTGCTHRSKGEERIQGYASETPADTDDTLRFSEMAGVRPMIETYPLDKAGKAYARMMSGQVRFRAVLTM